jgi:uncharacterized membrane protein
MQQRTGIFKLAFSIHLDNAVQSWTTIIISYKANAVSLARKKRIRAHQGWMNGLYFVALVLTGLFTLLLGRLIGRMLWA